MHQGWSLMRELTVILYPVQLIWIYFLDLLFYRGCQPTYLSTYRSIYRQSLSSLSLSSLILPKCWAKCGQLVSHLGSDTKHYSIITFVTENNGDPLQTKQVRKKNRLTSWARPENSGRKVKEMPYLPCPFWSNLTLTAHQDAGFVTTLMMRDKNFASQNQIQVKIF